MRDNIPIYFDNVIIASPIQQVSETNPNLGRLRVGVFTKYGNRNGSYITDEVAEKLIESATKGDTPVIGFFDPESKSWASHTGPTLASAYGYVESFEGWQPLTDTDGETRDYAVFNVVLFTKYFEEANLIVGQNQSMELDINSISGDWADINGVEYYVYTTAAIQGLCVIGAHEPCFSVSSFFAKNDQTYNTQYEKFSSLLAMAKAQVEEAEKQQKGGEQPMDEFENKEVVSEEAVEEPTPEVEVPVEEEVQPEEIPVEEEVATEEKVVTEEVEEQQVKEEEKTPSEFEQLKQQFDELQSSYDELKNQYEVAQNRVAELEAFQQTANTDIEALRAQNQELQTAITSYEAQVIAAQNKRKDELIDKYQKLITEEEEIKRFREEACNYSYGELESKLAIVFANQQLANSEEQEKVPLLAPEESQFALLMKKYRKN